MRTRLYALRPSNVSASNDVASAFATLYGDPATAWSDDDDATYVELNTSPLGSGWSGRGQGEFDYFPDLPTFPPGTTSQIRVRVWSDDGSLVGPRIIIQKGGLAWYDLNADGAAPRDAGTSSFAAAIPADAEDVRSALAGGVLNFEVRGPMTAAPGSVWRFYEMWLEFVIPVVGIPPLRQWPRADGLAASTARRKYPLDDTLQASQRRAGAYY